MEKLIVKLKDWIEANDLVAEFIDDRVFKLGESSFFLIPERRRKNTNSTSVFTEKFELNVTIDDEDFAKQIGVDNYCFQFGNNFYYTPEKTIEKPQLNPLKYIGKANDMLGLDYAFLGMRGKFELCNGSGDYSDWIKKSKFLGIKSLGICEHNTLAGTLPFQMACKKADMPFVLGETVTVRDSSYKEYLVKCYVINQKGWFNLLYINKIINVDNVDSQYIDEKELMKYGEGLVVVLDSEFHLTKSKVEKFTSSFDKVLYQMDMTEYKGEEKDKQRLLSQKRYMDKYSGMIDPILIQDAFYLDKGFSYVKPILNKIGGVKFQYDSKEQWFKSLDQIFMGWEPLFGEGDDRLYDMFIRSVENTMWIAENATYQIETGTRHLPQFKSDNGEDNEELFLRLIGEGMERLGLSEKQEYWERIEREVSVIKSGGVIDYFLILWDIVKWCKTKDILVGVGRGSAAGSLVSYTLGITGLDPIEYDLLFERFLTEDRLFKEEKYEAIVIEGDGGEEIVLDAKKDITVKRDSKKIKIKAYELCEGDIILEPKR